MENQIKQNIINAFENTLKECINDSSDINCIVTKFFTKINFILKNSENKVFSYISDLEESKKDFIQTKNEVNTFVQIESILNKIKFGKEI